jgi:ABC-type transporter Mla subunit MlaD
MTTTNAMLTETVELLESLSARSAELAATLPSLDLAAKDLAALAGDIERISARLLDVEERLANTGPVDCRS